MDTLPVSPAPAQPDQAKPTDTVEDLNRWVEAHVEQPGETPTVEQFDHAAANRLF